MKTLLATLAIVLLTAAPAFADPDCDRSPKSKKCAPSQPNGDGYCPEGTVYIDTWGCVPYAREEAHEAALTAVRGGKGGG